MKSMIPRAVTFLLLVLLHTKYQLLYLLNGKEENDNDIIPTYVLLM